MCRPAGKPQLQVGAGQGGAARISADDGAEQQQPEASSGGGDARAMARDDCSTVLPTAGPMEYAAIARPSAMQQNSVVWPLWHQRTIIGRA